MTVKDGMHSASLPEVFAALMTNEVETFPALRPHQRQANVSEPRLHYRRLSPRVRGSIGTTVKHRTVRWTISTFVEDRLTSLVMVHINLRVLCSY